MEHSVGIVVVKDRKYLLVHNKENEEWGFPKGTLNRAK